MQEDDEIELRPTLILPASDSFLLFPLLNAYFVGYILKSLSAYSYPCNPDHHLDKTSNFICNECVKSRSKYEAYLTWRLFNAVVNGKLELWSEDLKKVVAPPTNPNPESNDLWYWVMTTYIYQSDLSKFCKGERIHVEFDGKDKQEEKVLGKSHGSATVEKAKLDSEKSEEPAKEKPEPKGKRFDALAAEYDPILRKSPSLTATQLMALLLAHIGNPDTCILLNTGDGLQWDPGKGKPPKTLTIKKLEDRISRWRENIKTLD